MFPPISLRHTYMNFTHYLISRRERYVRDSCISRNKGEGGFPLLIPPRVQALPPSTLRLSVGADEEHVIAQHVPELRTALHDHLSAGDKLHHVSGSKQCRKRALEIDEAHGKERL